MTDLTDFLLARIAEDEAMAQRVLPYVEGDAQIEVSLYRSETLPDGTKRGITERVVPYDPARILAECEAKRRIVARHTVGYHGSCEGCGYSGPCDDPRSETLDECPELRDLAAIYADHEDYRQEWKP